MRPGIPLVSRLALPALVAGVLAAAVGARAGEICLRERVYCESGIVRLADIATVSDVDYAVREQLEQTALVPGPAPGHSRQISVSELRRILELRGVETAFLRVTGARRSLVVAGKPPAQPQPRAAAQPEVAAVGNRPVSTKQADVQKSAAAEIRDSLLASTPEIRRNLALWDVEVLIPREALWDLNDPWQSVEAEPLEPPYRGEHQVLATFRRAEQTRQFEVTVRVQRRLEAVVAARHLQKGDVIHDDDVQLIPVENSEQNEPVLRRLEDVVGQELTRDLQPGKPLTDALLRQPVLVTRRRSVMVTARRGSIFVKTPGIALADGGRNDVVMVEMLDNKNAPVPARVVAPGQVEVMTGVARAGSSDETRGRETRSGALRIR